LQEQIHIQLPVHLGSQLFTVLVYLYFKYTNIVNTWDPKCTGNWIWICSCKKSWWWLCRAETCSVACVFNNKVDVFDWKKSALCICSGTHRDDKY
jgi:hypothetical protein